MDLPCRYGDQARIAGFQLGIFDKLCLGGIPQKGLY